MAGFSFNSENFSERGLGTAFKYHPYILDVM